MNEAEALLLAEWDMRIDKLRSENVKLADMVWVYRVITPAGPLPSSRNRETKTERRIQPDEVRREVLLAIQTRTVSQVAKAYGIGERTIFKWKRAA